MANLLPFGSYTPKAAKREHDEIGDSSNSDFMKLVVGKNVIRILPPPEGSDTPFIVVHTHFVKTPGGKTVSFTCPRILSKGKQPCSECEDAKMMRASGNPLDRDEGYKKLPQRRVYAAVIDRKRPQDGPKILTFGKQVHEALLAYAADEDDPVDFTHPLEGRDIAIIREGTGQFDTSYAVKVAPRDSRLHESVEQMNAWLMARPDFDQYTRLLSIDEIARLTSGAGRGDRGRAQMSGGGQQRRLQSKNTVVDDAEFRDDDAPAGDDVFDELPEGV